MEPTYTITQEEIEKSHTKKSSLEYVLELVRAEPTCLSLIGDGIELIEAWAKEPSAYKAKAQRRESIALMDLKGIVEKIVVEVLLIRSTTTLASIAGKIGASLGFEDNRQGITLAAELLAVLLPTNLFEIGPIRPNGQWHVIPTLELSHEERAIAERGMYVPPSIVKPKKVRSNRDSGYQYLKGESLILGGKANHHEEDICLDVINIQNAIPLSLNFDFIDSTQDVPKTSIKEKVEKLRADKKNAREIKMAIEQHNLNWAMHQEQANYVYDLMDATGNKFYVMNKVDKRGRLYSQGHHVNPMGSSYKKSMIELLNKEKVEVPEGFFK